MSLENRLTEFEKCLQKFEEVLNLEENDVVRDSAIKRFELCFELCWKTLKDFLTEEGIICRSPRNCFKEAFSIGIIQDEDEWLSILEDRNLSVHTYDEALAEGLYSRLKNHLKAMKSLLEFIKTNL
ncbi:HI0074 family nucleotidyltransferase substrate-binding subunit [Venenivibrio stagnispumantis]|uniref:Nucleotidyltransferase substrate binding protein, HI0074 family n=1 Tax=Venenivibrio stagnispumantis TaxID=407998 RepID=A0AA45WN88_9AQUI|nr:nucleotidyltransferase substrate binding protein [Venenivibrio stagnispumantis]MCW4573195.1 nucleotidyltransferase substrate binding protein [Venenivibrio stagnispumantis]SMP17587.1 nucleotidyltransferase substrate binding protein, HI0074 family [Venenivibrio stagnispumantis]